MGIKKTLAIGAVFAGLAGCMIVPVDEYNNRPVYRGGYAPPPVYPPVYVPPPLIVVPRLYPFGWRHHHHGYGHRY